MSIYTILSEKADHRKGGTDCTFNGYLEDYLTYESELDPVLRDAFTTIVQEHDDARIIVNYHIGISTEAISNQIIRYKDIFKLKGKALNLPYMIYGEENGNAKALLVVSGVMNDEIYAKGIYYCMTEPGSEFIEVKNDIVVISCQNSDMIAKTYDRMFIEKAGQIQRRIDHTRFKNYQDLYKKSCDMANALCEHCFEELIPLEDRRETIYSYVVRWFLLKKIVYVQYMMDRQILEQSHGGDKRAQRNQAKNNAMFINIKGYSEMWRVTKDTETVAE